MTVSIQQNAAEVSVPSICDSGWFKAAALGKNQELNLPSHPSEPLSNATVAHLLVSAASQGMTPPTSPCNDLFMVGRGACPYPIGTCKISTQVTCLAAVAFRLGCPAVCANHLPEAKFPLRGGEPAHFKAHYRRPQINTIRKRGPLPAPPRPKRPNRIPCPPSPLSLGQHHDRPEAKHPQPAAPRPGAEAGASPPTAQPSSGPAWDGGGGGARQNLPVKAGSEMENGHRLWTCSTWLKRGGFFRSRKTKHTKLTFLSTWTPTPIKGGMRYDCTEVGKQIHIRREKPTCDASGQPRA